MNAKLRKIDAKGEILINDLKYGRITQEQFAKANRKLVDRAAAILDAMAARGR